MAKKINPIRKFLSNGAGKSIPLFLILALIGLVVGAGLNFSFGFKSSEVKADTAGTSVTVSNAAPTWTVDAEEGAESSTTNPTDAGQNVTFVATATDAENYYLAVCTTAEVTAVNGGAPTCNVGTWNVSASTASGSVATATYTTSESNDPSNAWFAYICDGHATAAACNATYKQGTTTTASPFVVNHGPSFTSVTDAGDPVNPGATVTITTTADDLEGAEPDDTLTLYVCKVAGATSTGCTGGATDTWCSDTSSPLTNPTCNWVMDINKTGSVTANQCKGAYNYYAYIFDNHGFAATTTGGQQGTVYTNTVSNVAPEVTAASLNTGTNFQLSTPATSDNILVTGTIQDNNGCEDINTNAAAKTSIYYFKSGVKGYADCDDDPAAEDDDNSCYSIRDCVYDSGSCAGTTDLASTFTCTVAIKYHANPTDGANATDSTWWDYTWRTTLKGTDEDATPLSHTLESSNIEMLSFMAYSVTESAIAYGGPLAPGATSANQTTQANARGNVGLDTNLYSTNANICTDYPTCSGSTIAIAQQKYAASDLDWDNAGMTALTTVTSAELELNCLKSTTATPALKNVHWKLRIPDPQVSGSYTGENTIIGKQGEAEDW